MVALVRSYLHRKSRDHHPVERILPAVRAAAAADFTTKGELGTGLGLAMVFGMAQRHRAELEIQSELGKGTNIQIWFPVPVAAMQAEDNAVTDSRTTN
jgi:signal transduction histidine kinase